MFFKLLDGLELHIPKLNLFYSLKKKKKKK